MTAAEAPYYRVSRGCHRAWLNTQPQFVIPGVLDETDAGTGGEVSVVLWTPPASVSSSAALRGFAAGSLASPGRGPRSIPPKEDK